MPYIPKNRSFIPDIPQTGNILIYLDHRKEEDTW